MYLNDSVVGYSFTLEVIYLTILKAFNVLNFTVVLRSFVLIPYMFIWNLLFPVLWNFTSMCLVQSLLIYYTRQFLSLFSLALHVFQLQKFFGIISWLLPFGLPPPSFSLFLISTVSPWIDLLTSCSSCFLCLF